MAWIDRLKEQLPSIRDDALILSLAVAGGMAAVAMAALFPLVVVASAAAVLATAVCVGATLKPPSKKGEKPAERWDTSATSSHGYFVYMLTQQEPSSSRFQDRVLDQDQPSQGWDR
jgi:hypothetical protein